MNLQISSLTDLKSESPKPNDEIDDFKSADSRQRSQQQNSQRQSSLEKYKTFKRKPAGRNTNSQSYKHLKRKSQQIMENNQYQQKKDIPPRYPKPAKESNCEYISTQISSTSQHLLLISNPISRQPKMKLAGQKFKKKNMSKQEIIEIKDYLKNQETDREDVNSVTASEKPIQNSAAEKMKQQNKKSKTQYFHIQDFQSNAQSQDYGEHMSETEKMFLMTLKYKCKTVDQNNTLLQKKLNWLKEEVEMHLERQANYQSLNKRLELRIKQLESIANQKENIYRAEVRKLQKSLQKKQAQIQSLKNMFIDMHNKFEDDQQILLQQIDYLKNQKQPQQKEELQQRRIAELQLALQKNIEQNKKSELNSENQTNHYSHTFIENLISQNKYLRIQQHVSGKYKDEVFNLQKQNKRISNQRDSLKKKIIQVAKREAQRYRQQDEEDSQNQQLFTLSELSSMPSGEAEY